MFNTDCFTAPVNEKWSNSADSASSSDGGSAERAGSGSLGMKGLPWWVHKWWNCSRRYVNFWLMFLNNMGGEVYSMLYLDSFCRAALSVILPSVFAIFRCFRVHEGLVTVVHMGAGDWCEANQRAEVLVYRRQLLHRLCFFHCWPHPKTNGFGSGYHTDDQVAEKYRAQLFILPPPFQILGFCWLWNHFSRSRPRSLGYFLAHGTLTVWICWPIGDLP